MTAITLTMKGATRPWIKAKNFKLSTIFVRNSLKVVMKGRRTKVIDATIIILL